mmetsp:Transcript_48502/g.125855  ORF Transcript_48502/g.125855 Transcript_48502/m.125855 type:complete len:380 (-) Transcript_48502:248-1387(-)
MNINLEGEEGGVVRSPDSPHTLEHIPPSDQSVKVVEAFYHEVNENKKKPNHPDNHFQTWNEQLQQCYDDLQDLGKTRASDAVHAIFLSFNDDNKDAIRRVQLKANRQYASRFSDFVSLFKLKMTDKLISRVGMGVFDPVADALANGLASLFKKNIEQHYCREEYRHLEPHLDAFIGRLRSNLVKMIKKRLTDASPGHRKWGVACVRELIDKAEKKLVNGRRFKVDEQAPFAETCANYAANLESIIERRVESKLMSMKKRLWRERKYEVALDIEALLSRPTQIVVELALKNTQAHFPSIIEAFVGYLKFAKSRQEGTAAVDLFPPAISVIDEAKTKLRSLHDSIKKLQDAGNVATAQFLGMRLMTPDNSFVDDEEDEAEF